MSVTSFLSGMMFLKIETSLVLLMFYIDNLFNAYLLVELVYNCHMLFLVQSPPIFLTWRVLLGQIKKQRNGQSTYGL